MNLSFAEVVVIFAAQYLFLLILAVAAGFFLLQPNRIKKSIAVCAAIIAPLSYLVAKIASHFYYDPRPFVIGHFTPLFFHAADNGFPSDHVLLTGAVASVIWFYSRKLGTILWVLVLLIGTARVLAGVHHGIDIIGSILIVIFSAVIYKFVKRPIERIAFLQ